MKRRAAISLLAIFCIILISGCAPMEHPGKPVGEQPGKAIEQPKAEHPGKPVEQPKAEHPGKPVERPAEHPGRPITAEVVKKSIQDYVEAQAKMNRGVFLVNDDKLNKAWRLKMVKIHDPVRMFEREGKTIYFACVDFESADSKDILDIDLWMVPQKDKLEVIEIRVHKVNGVPRYTFEGMNVKEIQ